MAWGWWQGSDDGIGIADPLLSLFAVMNQAHMGKMHGQIRWEEKNTTAVPSWHPSVNKSLTPDPALHQ